MTHLTPEQEKDLRDWFYPAYEEANGFTSTRDSTACQSRDFAFAWARDAFARALLAEQARTEPDLAPGVMRCARCKFRLHRINLNVNVGTVTAGDNKTEPCPNGCGPLWPVTWKQEAEEAMQVAEGLCDRAVAAERELADLRERLGPRAAQPLKAEQAKDAAEDAPKLWLWQNFVDGRPEYWAFDNPYPINLTDGDPQTLGEPCGYAIFKPSRQGRFDKSEEQVLAAIARAARAAERKAP